jgi:hypothetical protein
MTDLKTIPRKNARRRGVMKGTMATAGAAAAYAAPVALKMSVATAQTTGQSVSVVQCWRIQVGGRFTTTPVLGASSVAWVELVPQIGAAAGDLQFSNHIVCPATCTCPPVPALTLHYPAPDGSQPDIMFKLTSETSAQCIFGTEADVPVDLPDTFIWTGIGDLTQGGTDIALGVTIEATFTDLGEPGGVDTAAIKIYKGSTVYLNVTGVSDSPNTGNFTVLPFTCTPS